MLAILLIEMEWLKESRTPEGAAARQQHYKPVFIEDDVNLTGEGVFVKRCKFYQNKLGIQSVPELMDMQNLRLAEATKGKAFAGSDEYAQRELYRRKQSAEKDKGTFWPMERINIPCIAVEKEENGYRIKWYDDRRGMPYRRGGNEDFGKKGKKLAGDPNVLNETAFVLEEGKAGLLKYNYRYTSYHGQWYKCYYVYVVNCKELSRDIFVRDYDYEYSQLADLF